MREGILGMANPSLATKPDLDAGAMVIAFKPIAEFSDELLIVQYVCKSSTHKSAPTGLESHLRYSCLVEGMREAFPAI